MTDVPVRTGPPGRDVVASYHSLTGTRHLTSAFGSSSAHRHGRLLLPLAILLQGACMACFHQPTVRLDTVRVTGLGLNGGTLYAAIVVNNPNGYELRTSSLNFTIDLRHANSEDDAWVRAAEGTLDRELSIAAGDSAAIEVPVEFTWAGVGSALRSVIRNGRVGYRLIGDMDVTRPRRRTVPFEKRGQVDLVNSR